VTCHPGEVNQVLLNLLVNAAHAIGDAVAGSDRRGVIRVRTGVEGHQVVVSISDNGPGIAPTIRERIFEPFFTTKEVGKGTGQGLAISRSLVEKHGGKLSFESPPGGGATFFVRLPVAPTHPTPLPGERRVPA
jgi:two-component system, NtrC family, sensor kinase